MPVRVEWVQGRWSCQTLRRDRLDDVTRNDVLLELCHESLVSLLPDVRDSLAAENDGLLVHLRSRRAHHELRKSSGFGYSGLVDEREVDLVCVSRAEDVRDDLQALVEVVVDEEGVDQHEDGLRNAKGVFEGAQGLRLEMLDGIVPNISDRTTSECWYFGKLDVLVHSELLLKCNHGIASDLLIRPNTDDLEGVLLGLSVCIPLLN